MSCLNGKEDGTSPWTHFPPQERRRGLVGSWDCCELCGASPAVSFMWFCEFSDALNLQKTASLITLFPVHFTSAQGCFIGVHHVHMHVRLLKVSQHSAGPVFAHTNWCRCFVIHNLIIKKKCPKCKHTALPLVLTVKKDPVLTWDLEPEITEHLATKRGSSCH